MFKLRKFCARFQPVGKDTCFIKCSHTFLHKSLIFVFVCLNGRKRTCWEDLILMECWLKAYSTKNDHVMIFKMLRCISTYFIKREIYSPGKIIIKYSLTQCSEPCGYPCTYIHTGATRNHFLNLLGMKRTWYTRCCIILLSMSSAGGRGGWEE